MIIIAATTCFSTAQPAGIKILMGNDIASSYVSEDVFYTAALKESNNYNEVHTSACVYLKAGSVIKVQEKVATQGQVYGGVAWIMIS